MRKQVCTKILAFIRIDEHVRKWCCRIGDIRCLAKSFENFADQAVNRGGILILFCIDRSVVRLVVNQQQRQGKLVTPFRHLRIEKRDQVLQRRLVFLHDEQHWFADIFQRYAAQHLLVGCQKVKIYRGQHIGDNCPESSRADGFLLSLAIEDGPAVTADKSAVHPFLRLRTQLLDHSGKQNDELVARIGRLVDQATITCRLTGLDISHDKTLDPPSDVGSRIATFVQNVVCILIQNPDYLASEATRLEFIGICIPVVPFDRGLDILEPRLLISAMKALACHHADSDGGLKLFSNLFQRSSIQNQVRCGYLHNLRQASDDFV